MSKYTPIVISIVFTLTVLVMFVLFGKNTSVKSSEAEPSKFVEDLHRASMDMQVIDQLQKAGSDMTKPHEIEHFFVFNEKSDGEALIDWAHEQNFSTSGLKHMADGDPPHFYMNIIISTIPKIENILPDTTLMQKKATEFNGVYDGWGCAVIK